MQIYISRDGEQNGPYSIEDVNAYLKDGTLLPTDLACQEGMDEWVQISQISGVVMPEGSVAPQEQQTRNWGMLIHLSCAFPVLGWIASIVLWKLKVKKLPEIDEHGKNSANWIISNFIYLAVIIGVYALIWALINMWALQQALMILKVLATVMFIYAPATVILPGISALKAYKGEVWKNPLTITILK